MITIAETEYSLMQQQIVDLEKKVALLQDEQFIQKLNMAYYMFVTPEQRITINYSLPDKRVKLKRGSAKEYITYISDDFTAPLDDFKEYM